MSADSLPPIILLHGCGGSPEAAWNATGWTKAIEARGRRSIALRLPGHGRGGLSHDPVDYADLTALVLDALPQGTIDIVGFSLGAKLALAVMLRAPAKIRRAVLCGVGDNVFAPEVIGEAAASALEHGPTAQTPTPVLAFLETWDPYLNDPLAIAAILRRPANPVFSIEQIATISTSIAIANGADDFVGKMGTRLIDTLKIDQTIVPGTGHFDLTAHAAFRTFALDYLQT